MPDPETITIEVLLFGHARELAGAGRTTLRLPADATVAVALERLLEAHPALGSIEPVLLAAVNETYATRDATVADRDTLAVFPPVSGGEEEGGDFCELTREEISIAAMRARLLRGEDGAVCVFDGVARNNTKGRATRYLEYEGYDEMAVRTMRQIVDEVHAKWPGVDRVGITHRLGKVEVGESSVVIVVTAAHRAVTFDACRYAIDRLKQIVPVWKKEYFVDGYVWVQGEAYVPVASAGDASSAATTDDETTVKASATTKTDGGAR